jgi:carbamoyl-phosphate synthase small subunit
MKALLILEDGTVYEGESIGAEGQSISEIVFNTSMTGYLEVLTDPSYAGQAVCMTYPLIGNYGVTPDMESEKSHVGGFIVRELSRKDSNFRSTGTLSDFLKNQGIVGISGIDTRSLVKKLRDHGTMNGMITTDASVDPADVMPAIENYRVGDVVSRVTVDEPKHLAGKGPKVALLDLGMKKNIAKSLNDRGCDVTILPAHTTAEEIFALNPDGIMLSNGPGDPKDCGSIISEIKKLYDSDVPIFAICLGHQLMALATGADTYKLKYGHRGGNHPVKDLATGRVYITSQNHGYAVDEASLDESVASSAFINVNDRTNEGLKYRGKHIFTVQFHPEACPGPCDCGFLFDRFMGMMGGKTIA